MTLGDMLWTGAAIAYGGVALGYTHERLRRRTEIPFFDILFFPCMLLWALPYGVYHLGLVAGRGLERHLPLPPKLRSRLRLGWGIIHAAAVCAFAILLLHGWRDRLSLRVQLMLFGVLLPLEIFVAVPPSWWKWNPEGR